MNELVYVYVDEDIIQIPSNNLIDYLENLYDGKIPDEYKEFLSKYSGIHLSPNKKKIFKTDLKGLVSPFIQPRYFSSFAMNKRNDILWAINHSPKPDSIEKTLNNLCLDKKLLVIASDNFFNYILINISKTKYNGKISYYNINTKSNEIIADSLNDFINNIKDW